MIPTTRISLPATVLALACAPVPPPSTIAPAGATTAAITPADLRHRVGIFAHDSMMGRESGTIYNDKGTAYIAAELARMGLEPAGDGGTYFQHVPLVRRSFASGTQLRVGDRSFVIGEDFVPRDQGPGMRQISGTPVVFGGVWSADTSRLLSSPAAAGRTVIIHVPGGWIANRGLLTTRYRDAAGIVIATLDRVPAAIRRQLSASSFGLAPDGDTSPLPAFMYMTRAMAEAAFGRSLDQLEPGATGTPFTGRFVAEQEQAAGSRNVVALLRGSDPALRGQYVAFGAHNDHVGFSMSPADHDSLRAFNRVVRPGGAESPNRAATAEEVVRVRTILDSLRALGPSRPDSIFNGADDDGSGSMAVLELAEVFARSATPPRRSILFVWHTAEESGLFGSLYFTDNPTVPRDSIVAQINVDMIGRGGAADIRGGGPGYVQAIGSRRQSTELGQLVDEVAATMTPPLNIDYQFDARGHPQQFFCRSDHYSYARYGIPIAFFTTGSHVDYHQITDEAQYLDYEKLALITSFARRLGERIANQAARLVVDQPKPDPQAPCVQ